MSNRKTKWKKVKTAETDSDATVRSEGPLEQQELPPAPPPVKAPKNTASKQKGTSATKPSKGKGNAPPKRWEPSSSEDESSKNYGVDRMDDGENDSPRQLQPKQRNLHLQLKGKENPNQRLWRWTSRRN